MSGNIDYYSALTKLAKAQVKAILDGGEGLQERLEFIIQKNLRNYPQEIILEAVVNQKILKHHTYDTKPTISGMYLKLLHGRAKADAELDDWGDDGPWIGPLIWFHCTYLTNIGIGFVGGDELNSQYYNIEIPTPMYLYQEMLYYDGMYYGIWELQSI